ncbi:hypothetical protein PFICI_02845 [Pestalotiopsis fici W106-1]|uniref:DUF7704 domain-containing protein n=1 Tax=Pestalotiopsis fici (strain W106-1 / CGMCC3.15140) TaxID=1229662 RepID=W3XFL4_PESFW|nr:uncharacterized protein PFICI_02845 [Pestalotiopsis fici W106-1]ETS84820.1 hypothetical protein PFICI_02845 [Pestalotiopsis fici W106-1]
MAPPQTLGSQPIPPFYRLWFTIVDPIVCLGTSFMCFWDPDLGLTSVVPVDIATRNPYQDFLFHQTGGLYLMLAIHLAVLLRYTSDLGVWKINQAAVLVVDFILLWSQYYSQRQQGRLALDAWRQEDYAAAAITIFVAVLRTCFLLNVGFEPGKTHEKAN